MTAGSHEAAGAGSHRPWSQQRVRLVESKSALRRSQTSTATRRADCEHQLQAGRCPREAA